MKKTIFLIVIALFSFACGKDHKNNADVKVIEKEKPCDCSQVKNVESLYYKDAILYTGDCQKLDQNDTVIEYYSYKNGHLASEIKREKVGKRYYITDSLSYDEKGRYSGFKCSFRKLDYDVYICEAFFEYVNGEVKQYSGHLEYMHGFRGMYVHRPDGTLYDYRSKDDEVLTREGLLEALKEIKPLLGAKFRYWVE